MTLQNLFIMGAPKCGTTALAEYLEAHPNACMAKIKEVCFFLDRDHWNYRSGLATYHNSSLDAYEKYFAGCQGEQTRVRFEATPHYVYQRTALKVIPSLPTRPIMVFMVREPVQTLWSRFRFVQNNGAGLPPDMTFSQFVANVKDPSVEFARRYPYCLDAIRTLQYVHYLVPFRDRVPKERLKVYLAEDLWRVPSTVLKDLCASTGLDPAFYTDFGFRRVNETIRIKRQGVHRIVNKAKRFLPRAFGWRVLRTSRLKRFYRRVNAAPPLPKTAEDIELMAQLREEFRAANERLAGEMDLDLSSWQ